MPKLIILSLRARKRITSTTQRSVQSLFKQNYRKQKNRENLALHRYAPAKTRSTPHRPKTVRKLHHSPRRSLTRANLKRKKVLFKTNKTRNTTIKNSNRSGGDDGHWPALAHFGGDGRHSTLAGGWNWLKLLHMAQKKKKKKEK